MRTSPHLWETEPGLSQSQPAAASPAAGDSGWQDDRMQTPDPILDLLDSFTPALNAHDLDAVLALVSQDIVFEATSPAPDGTRYQARPRSGKSGQTCSNRRRRHGSLS